jgi:hypothetical protein
MPDGASRPVLVRAGEFIPGKARIEPNPDRKPTATVSMEIDTLGNPGKMRAEAASLPAWGEDAMRTLRE